MNQIEMHQLTDGTHTVGVEMVGLPHGMGTTIASGLLSLLPKMLAKGIVTMRMDFVNMRIAFRRQKFSAEYACQLAMAQDLGLGLSMAKEAVKKNPAFSDQQARSETLDLMDKIYQQFAQFLVRQMALLLENPRLLN